MSPINKEEKRFRRDKQNELVAQRTLEKRNWKGHGKHIRIHDIKCNRCKTNMVYHLCTNKNNTLKYIMECSKLDQKKSKLTEWKRRLTTNRSNDGSVMQTKGYTNQNLFRRIERLKLFLIFEILLRRLLRYV